VEKELEKMKTRFAKASQTVFAKSFEGSNFGDVMIVGGGVSGVQASLDLGRCGF